MENLAIHDSQSNANLGEKLYKCKYCDRCFHQSSDCTAHESLTHAGEKGYKCKHCDNSLSSAWHLKMHERRHTGKN